MPAEVISPAPATSSSAASVVLKPLRLNFAQVCLWCGMRWCQSATCIARHDASVWIVCERCDGFAGMVECDICVNGVVEATAQGLAAQAGRVLAERPEDLPCSPGYVITDSKPVRETSTTVETLWRVCEDHAGRSCAVCDGIGFIPVEVPGPAGAPVRVQCANPTDPGCRCLLCELVDTNAAYVVRETAVAA